MSATDDLRSIVGDRVRENEPMSRHTTLGVGGPADYFVEVISEDELSALMAYVSSNSLDWMVIGDGANLLVADKGIRGVVIRMGGALREVTVDRNVVTAGSAATISGTADIAAQHDLGGLEGVGDVPGSVGGAIVMNAGTHRGYIDQVTRSVSVVTSTGEKRAFPHEKCGFSYRGSRFQTDRSMLITFVTLELQPGDGKAILENLQAIRRRRWEKQPTGKSAGCFFKNLPDQSAGKLIEAAGAKGMREGGAVVSDIHANFIMNDDNATASDLYKLSRRVRDLVREVHGVELEYEVRLVGEW